MRMIEIIRTLHVGDTLISREGCRRLWSELHSDAGPACATSATVWLSACAQASATHDERFDSLLGICVWVFLSLRCRLATHSLEPYFAFPERLDEFYTPVLICPATTFYERLDEHNT